MRAFLTDLLEPESPITTITFLDKEPQPQNKLERGVIYDLRCMTEDGGEFIVEMQNSPQEYFADRILFLDPSPLRATKARSEAAEAR